MAELAIEENEMNQSVQNVAQDNVAPDPPKTPEQKLRALYDMMSSDEVFYQFTPTTFDGFIKHYSDPNNFGNLHSMFQKDEIFRELIPSDIKEAARAFGLTPAPETMGKPSLATQISSERGGQMQGATSQSPLPSPSAKRTADDFAMAGASEPEFQFEESQEAAIAKDERRVEREIRSGVNQIDILLSAAGPKVRGLIEKGLTDGLRQSEYIQLMDAIPEQSMFKQYIGEMNPMTDVSQNQFRQIFAEGLTAGKFDKDFAPRTEVLGKKFGERLSEQANPESVNVWLSQFDDKQRDRIGAAEEQKVVAELSKKYGEPQARSYIQNLENVRSLSYIPEDERKASELLREQTEILKKENPTSQEMQRAREIELEVQRLREESDMGQTASLYNPVTGQFVSGNEITPEIQQFNQEVVDKQSEYERTPLELLKEMRRRAYFSMLAYKEKVDSQGLSSVSDWMWDFVPGDNTDVDNYRSALTDFMAINRAIELNVDPATVTRDGSFTDAFVAGFADRPDDVGNTNRAFVTSVLNQFERNGITVTDAQKERLTSEFSEQLGQALGTSANIMVKLAAEMIVSRGIKSALGIKKYATAIESVLKSTRLGRTSPKAARFLSRVIGNTADVIEQGVLFEGAGQGAATGMGEEFAQKLMDLVPGFNNRILRMVGGITGEVIGEYVGEFTELANKYGLGDGLNDAFRETFGRNPTEAWDKLLLTVVAVAPLSGTSALLGPKREFLEASRKAASAEAKRGNEVAQAIVDMATEALDEQGVFATPEGLAQEITAETEVAPATETEAAVAEVEAAPVTETAVAPEVAPRTVEDAISGSVQVERNGVRGNLILDGQTVVFEHSDGRVLEDVDNVDAIKGSSIADFGFQEVLRVEADVNPEDMSVTIDGVTYQNNYSNPDAAINYDSDGNVVSVTLDTQDGKKRTFRGERAQEIAYQYKLIDFEKNATEEQIESILQRAKQIEQTEGGAIQAPVTGEAETAKGDVATEGEVATEPVIQALENVESTANALDENAVSQIEERVNMLFPKSENTNQVVSESYHAAKAKPKAERTAQDNELIAAVEEVLTPKTETDATKEGEQQQGSVPERAGVTKQEQGKGANRQNQEADVAQGEAASGGGDSATQGGKEQEVGTTGAKPTRNRKEDAKPGERVEEVEGSGVLAYERVSSSGKRTYNIKNGGEPVRRVSKQEYETQVAIILDNLNSSPDLGKVAQNPAEVETTPESAYVFDEPVVSVGNNLPASTIAVFEETSAPDADSDLVGEEESESEVTEAEMSDSGMSKSTGIPAKNIRDLYGINRNLFGLSRIRSFANAIVMDKMIGAMAKRAGISKEEMYGRLSFEKTTQSDVIKMENALFQGVVNGQTVNLRNLDVDVVNGFYSPIEKRLAETKIEKQSANKWLSLIGKGDEAVWTGVKDWLESKNPQEQVSKSEIQQWMKDNRISVVEVVKEAKVKPEQYQRFDEIIDTLKSRGYDVEVEDYGGMDMSVTGVDDGLVYLDTGSNYFKREDLIRDGYSVKDTYEEDVNLLEEAKKIASNISYRQEKEETLDDTKFSEYQLEGEKENYKEVLVTLPNIEKATSLTQIAKELGYGDVSDAEYGRMPKEDRDKIRAEREKRLSENNKTPFKSSHFDEPNILVHLRMNTRTDAQGNKVLFLEEVQSDWGQQGKRVGFTTGEKVGNFSSYIKDDLKLDWSDEKIKQEFNNRDSREYKEWDRIKTQQSKTPAAPFVTDTNAWVKMGLKVALKEAVRQGADKIAWTTGEQQNDRYSLEKVADEVRYKKNEDGTYGIVAYKDGESVSEDKRLPESKLEETLGKDVAQRIIDGAGEDVEGQKSLTGENLKVGGKGMKGFYGSPTEGSLGIVGNVAKSLFKQDVGTVDIDTNVKGKATKDFDDLKQSLEFEKKLKDNGKKGIISTINKDGSYTIEWKENKPSAQNSIDITPELRSEVERGLALFQRGQGGQAMGAMVAADGGYIIYALTDPNVSTPLHELAHVFEHYLTPSERQTVIRNAGTSEWNTQTSEYFARGFEKYLADGSSPNASLSRLFEKFKEWLTEIYNGIKNSPIDIQLNDEMRSIYASMLGEDAISEAPVQLESDGEISLNTTDGLFEGEETDEAVANVIEAHTNRTPDKIAADRREAEKKAKENLLKAWKKQAEALSGSGFDAVTQAKNQATAQIELYKAVAEYIAIWAKNRIDAGLDASYDAFYRTHQSMIGKLVADGKGLIKPANVNINSGIMMAAYNDGVDMATSVAAAPKYTDINQIDEEYNQIKEASKKKFAKKAKDRRDAARAFFSRLDRALLDHKGPVKSYLRDLAARVKKKGVNFDTATLLRNMQFAIQTGSRLDLVMKRFQNDIYRGVGRKKNIRIPGYPDAMSMRSVLDMIVFHRTVISKDRAYEASRNNVEKFDSELRAAGFTDEEIKKITGGTYLTSGKVNQELATKINDYLQASGQTEPEFKKAARRRNLQQEHINRVGPAGHTHPFGTDLVKSQKALDIFKQALGDASFAEISGRADTYFEANRSLLRERLNSGEITQALYDEIIDRDYMPTVWDSSEIDAQFGESFREAGFDIVNQKGNSTLMYSYKGGSQTTSMAFTDSEKLLEMNAATTLKRINRSRLFNFIITNFLPAQDTDLAIAIEQREKQLGRKLNAKEQLEVRRKTVVMYELANLGVDKTGKPKYEKPIDNQYSTVVFTDSNGRSRAFAVAGIAKEMLDTKGAPTPSAITSMISMILGTTLIKITAVGANTLFAVGQISMDVMHQIMVSPGYKFLPFAIPIRLGIFGFNIGQNVLDKAVNQYRRMAAKVASGKATVNERNRYMERVADAVSHGLDYGGGLFGYKPLAAEKSNSPIAQKLNDAYELLLSTISTTELAVRMTTYQMLANHFIRKISRSAEGKKMTPQEIVTKAKQMAAYEASNVMNYASRGTATSYADAISPFFNATKVAVSAHASKAFNIERQPAEYWASVAQIIGGGVAWYMYILSQSEDDERNNIVPVDASESYVLNNFVMPMGVGENRKGEKAREMFSFGLDKITQLYMLAARGIAEQIYYSGRMNADGTVPGRKRVQPTDFAKAFSETLPGIGSIPPTLSLISATFFNFDTFRMRAIYTGEKGIPANQMADERTKYLYRKIARFIPIPAAQLQAGVSKVIAENNPIANALYNAFAAFQPLGEGPTAKGEGELGSFFEPFAKKFIKTAERGREQMEFEREQAVAGTATKTMVAEIRQGINSNTYTSPDALASDLKACIESLERDGNNSSQISSTIRSLLREGIRSASKGTGVYNDKLNKFDEAVKAGDMNRVKVLIPALQDTYRTLSKEEDIQSFLSQLATYDENVYNMILEDSQTLGDAIAEHKAARKASDVSSGVFNEYGNIMYDYEELNVLFDLYSTQLKKSQSK